MVSSKPGREGDDQALDAARAVGEFADDEVLKLVLDHLRKVRRSGKGQMYAAILSCARRPSPIPVSRHQQSWTTDPEVSRRMHTAGDPRRAELPDLAQRYSVIARREPIRVHAYHGPDGRVIAEKLRWHGRGESSLGGAPMGRAVSVDATRGLHRRPAVDCAVHNGEAVWLVEGERDADSLVGLGKTATTSPHGAGTWRPEWTDMLVPAPVIIVADRDAKGVKHARDVGTGLRAAGCTVTLLVSPAPHKDVSELIDVGGTLDDLEEIGGGLRPQCRSHATAPDQGRPTLFRHGARAVAD